MSKFVFFQLPVLLSIFLCSSLTAKCCPGVRGPKGVDGTSIDGATGPTGPQGPTGPTGPSFTGTNFFPSNCPQGMFGTFAQIELPPTGASSGSTADYSYTATSSSLTLTFTGNFDQNAVVVATPQGTGGIPANVTITRTGTSVLLNILDINTNVPVPSQFINFVAFECQGS